MMTGPAIHTPATAPLTRLPAAHSAKADKTTAARGRGTGRTTILGLFAIPLGIADWRAQHGLAAALPEAWVAGSSGSSFRLTAA